MKLFPTEIWQVLTYEPFVLAEDVDEGVAVTSATVWIKQAHGPDGWCRGQGLSDPGKEISAGAETLVYRVHIITSLFEFRDVELEDADGAKIVPVPAERAPDAVGPSNVRRGAFTLIELLVVVCIITVLLAIMLPALRTARLAAREARCTANMKQILTVVSVYVDEDRNHFLPAPFYSQVPRDPPVGVASLPTLLETPAAGIWTCPDDKDRETSPWVSYSYHPGQESEDDSAWRIFNNKVTIKLDRTVVLFAERSQFHASGIKTGYFYDLHVQPWNRVDWIGVP